ncbi:MAG: ATP-grasp domain-containing protein [Chlorobi bacterium]|nr:ATP-grasp domain-containing protein [Chlorobiota bacterium]
MILIDKPYVSDFLIETIKKNNFQIISTTVAREMIQDNSLNWISGEKAKQIIKSNPKTRIYTNSENSISWIEKNLAFSNLPAHIQVFKDKIQFRELIKASYPNYFFQGVKFDELRKLNIAVIRFPIIVKPAVGFFSLAVHKVENRIDWPLVLDKIENEIGKLSDIYPKEVIDVTDFIIEEYIAGEEYAIDCYYDNSGKPIVLNILHHIFSSGDDVSDRVYSTSKEILYRHSGKIQEFLELIGIKVGLKDFPAHVEVRIDNKGKLFPIEVNPLRYGGLCTTGDLTWYAYGFNSYECFLNNIRPDWEQIFNTRGNKKYSIIVLNNNSGIRENDIAGFDYELLLKDFKKPLSLRKVDFRKYLVFGFLFIETRLGNDEELTQILTSDLRKYIMIK